MPRLREVLAVLDAAYDPADAESWDAVGLVTGDPSREVRRVHLAVDPVLAVADEAVDAGADLLVTHHPLFLRGVHGIPETDPKGRLVARLLRAGCALFVAHTNADVARPGVSDALADALGLSDLRPLAARPDPLDKLVTFVPHPQAEPVIDALAGAGAGAIGDYDRCAWTAPGTGTFRPGAGARPVIGTVGQVERVPETRVEMVLPRRLRSRVVAALQAAHPYEEPAYDVMELAVPPDPGGRGLGRVGDLADPEPLAGFVARAAAVLPATAWGVRAAGDPARPVRTVAVCGGSGGSEIATAVAAGADAFLTADLRHHVVSEHLEGSPMALVDAAHWATEAPWLSAVAALLRRELADTVAVTVSGRVTDPWTLHRSAPASEALPPRERPS